MHTDKINERRGLSKLVGLAVAGATLLAGMVALPATQASAFDSADDFQAGAIDDNKQPHLTVTKYLSTGKGHAPTGSITDAPIAGSGDITAQDIVFDLKEIKATGTVSQIDLNDPSTYTFGSFKATGMTNGSGVIDTWYPAQTAGANQGQPDTSAAPLNIPKSLHYYILTENRAVSPAFTSGRLDPTRYERSDDSFFGLPYKSKDGSNTGYIYHLHVFPKNVDTSSVSKSVVSINGNTNLHIAKAGDTIKYRVTQRLYNEVAPVASDQKLDLNELAGGYSDLRVVDKMGSSLNYVTNSAAATIKWSDGQYPLKDPSDSSPDFKVSTSRTKFDRIADLAPANSTLFASDDDSSAKYTAFDFFRDGNAIRSALGPISDHELALEITYDATVTTNGDSTGNGGVVNDVESDIKDNNDGTAAIDPPSARAVTASGSIAFGKLKKNSTGDVVPAEGAVFRLADPADPAKYLCADGTFQADGPGGAQFMTATSNSKGLVAFTGLPILDARGLGTSKHWDVVEYTAPAGLDRAPNPFAEIAFKSDVVNQSAADIATAYRNKPIEPDYTKLEFGQYGANIPRTTIKFYDHDVEKYMMNWKSTDPDSPVGLPLTGGRGIIMLLVAGVIIMGGALYARSRRNAARV